MKLLTQMLCLALALTWAHGNNHASGGSGEDSDRVERERCSRVHLDAVTSDNAGNMYAFRGHHFLRRHKGNDALKADTIENAFKELHSEVDAAFSYQDHLYMIKDDDLYVYKTGEPHTPLEGYPKPVEEELGIQGPVDAAFVCEDLHIAHIIKGQKMYNVDLRSSPRVASNELRLLLFNKIDAATCDRQGVKVIVGNHFYGFYNPMVLILARVLPKQHRVSVELFGCDH